MKKYNIIVIIILFFFAESDVKNAKSPRSRRRCEHREYTVIIFGCVRQRQLTVAVTVFGTLVARAEAFFFGPPPTVIRRKTRPSRARARADQRSP